MRYDANPTPQSSHVTSDCPPSLPTASFAFLVTMFRHGCRLLQHLTALSAPDLALALGIFCPWRRLAGSVCWPCAFFATHSCAALIDFGSPDLLVWLPQLSVFLRRATTLSLLKPPRNPALLIRARSLQTRTPLVKMLFTKISTRQQKGEKKKRGGDNSHHHSPQA